MPEPANIFLDLFILFASAKIAGEILRLVGQPAVVDEIAAYRLGNAMPWPSVLA